MRRDTRRYKPLFKEYEEMLRALVKQGEIQCNTAERRLSHASRILEACVRGMPLDSLYAITKVWFPGRSCGRVIKDLEVLVKKRPRKAR
jgi:hypothetical protein